MPTVWTVEIRLGERPDASPVRRQRVVAETEADALREALHQIESSPDGPELVADGQEEVFARAEVEAGSEHQSAAGDHHRGGFIGRDSGRRPD